MIMRQVVSAAGQLAPRAKRTSHGVGAVARTYARVDCGHLNQQSEQGRAADFRFLGGRWWLRRRAAAYQHQPWW